MVGYENLAPGIVGGKVAVKTPIFEKIHIV
jgi:uncharacterized membrane protein